MIKNNKIILASVLLVVVLISFILAGNIETIYFQDESGNPLTDVDYLVYECSNADCTSVVQKVFDLNSGSKSYVTYEYPSTAFKYYASYIFKECYSPWEDTYTNDGDGWVSDWTYKIEQKDSCSSEVSSFSVTNTNYANEPVVINMQASLDATTKSAFSRPNSPPYWYPFSEFADYYSAETEVTLEILNSNNDVVYTATRDLNLKVDSSENVQFTWVPTVEGDYTAVITSSVTDCQCSSHIDKTSSKIFNVLPDQPADECYTILNNLDTTQGVNFVTIEFDKISNYADNSYIKTAVPTRINYEIGDNLGNVIYSDYLLVLANPDAVNPQEVELTWTPPQDGDYNLRVTGVAESSLCIGKTNPQDTISIGFFGTAPPIIATEYTITFNVRNFLMQPLAGAEVNLNGITALTNSFGVAEIEIDSGNYYWFVSLDGYITSDGTIAVNDDETITVFLFPGAVCGNGFLETGEQCDDGNNVNGDGCTANCLLEGITGVCGNSVLETGEQCEDGNNVNGDGCSSTCQNEDTDGDGIPDISDDDIDGDGILNGDDPDYNGDGILDEPFDTVDPNGDIDGDGIINIDDEDMDGDGILNGDDPDFDGDGVFDIFPNPVPGTYCGDGIVQLPNEQCDDGNSVGGDGCSSICISEINGGGSRSSSSCTPEWDCSLWSECVGGIKIRNCVDTKMCGVSYNRPAERMGCSETADLQSNAILNLDSKNASQSFLRTVLNLLPWIFLIGIIALLLVLVVLFIIRLFS